MGIAPSLFSNLRSTERRPYVESMRRRGAAIPFGRGTKRGRGGGGEGGRGDCRMRRSRDAGGRRKWNQHAEGGSRKWNRHAERGVGGKGKLNQRIEHPDGD